MMRFRGGGYAEQLEGLPLEGGWGRRRAEAAAGGWAGAMVQADGAEVGDRVASYCRLLLLAAALAGCVVAGGWGDRAVRAVRWRLVVVGEQQARAGLDGGPGRGRPAPQEHACARTWSAVRCWMVLHVQVGIEGAGMPADLVRAL